MTSDEADRCGPPDLVFRLVGMRSCRFECRPTDRSPPERTIAWLYRREGEIYHAKGVGVFEDGRWTNGKGRELETGGLHWTAVVDE